MTTTLGGLLLRRRSGRALRRIAGGIGHFLLGTLVFPAAYALIFELAGRADLSLGAILGGGHALLAGLLLPLAWRGARQEKGAGTGAGAGAGIFGWRLGAATVPGLIAAHVLYGALLGYIYVAP